jgi:PAS domain S-box-containing protein
VHVTAPVPHAPRPGESVRTEFADAAPDSDSPLRLFIDHAPAAVAMFDREMRYVAASRRWRDHYGLPAALEGRSHYELLPDIPDAWREVHRRALGGVPQGCDSDVWQRADGSAQYLKWQVLPWYTRAHEVGGVLITVEDVTDRVRFEQALERAERNSRSILESISDGFLAIDRDWRLTYVNRVAARMLGEEPERLIGRTICDVYPGVVDSAFAPVIRAAMEEGRAGRQAAYYAGHGRWYEAAVYPYADGISVQLRDVTEQRAAEQRLQRTEARQQLAMRAGRLAAWEYDAATGRNTWDERMAELLGVPPARAAELQDSWREFVHPADRPLVGARFAAALRGEGAFEVEYRAIRLDGEERWFASRADEVRDENGRLVRLVGIVQDVSTRRAAEATLRAFYEASPLLMGTVELTADGDLHHLYDNPASNRFFAVPQGGTSDRTARELGVPERVIALWRTRYEQCAASGSAVEFEYEHRTEGDAVPRVLAVTVAPLDSAGPHGRPAFCYVAEDVTRRRSAEAALLESEAALRDAARRKDEFLATLSHELRNPLAPIRTAAQILASPKVTPAQLHWSQGVIRRQVGHMARLLDDLLDVARITRGKLQLKKETVSLRGVIDSAVEAARPLLDARRHRLELRLPAGDPGLVADPLRLSQVLSNLLTNAAKYTDPGGHVTLSATLQDDGALRLSVADDGIGIPPAALAQVFTMFAQVPGTGGRGDGGLGIGLALVRGLVELHGGTIEARSDGPGRGSEFVVRLPPLRAAFGAAAAAVPIEAAPDSSRRVLVADDNRDAADSLAMLLSLAGHEVRVAHGGDAALAEARAFRPEVALLDIGMPDVDGYGVARALRTEPWGRQLRIVALTGWGQDGDKQLAAEAGFDAHLTKPVDPAMLESLVAGRSS